MEGLYELTGREVKEVLEEKIPCGKSIVTAYRLNGALVRQDVLIEVDRNALPPLGSACKL